MSGLRTFCRCLPGAGLALCLTLAGMLPVYPGAAAYAGGKAKPVVQFPDWEAAPPTGPSDTPSKTAPLDTAIGTPSAPVSKTFSAATSSRIEPTAAVNPSMNAEAEIPAVLNMPRFGSSSPLSESNNIHPVVMSPVSGDASANQPNIQRLRTPQEAVMPLRSGSAENAPSEAYPEADVEAPMVTALPRYRGGAAPIEAITTDERGRPVLLVPKNTPIPEFRVGSEAYNSLFMAEPAESDAQKIARLLQEALASYQKADWTQALVKIQQALALNNQSNRPDVSRAATLQAAQAEIFVKQNRLPEALEALKKASTLAPGQYDLRTAQILVQAGRRTEALPILERLYRDKPNDPNIAFALGTLSEDLGDAQRALTLLKQAANLHPASADIQYNLGLAFELSGNPEEAERHYQQALALNPQAGDATLALERLKNPSP